MNFVCCSQVPATAQQPTSKTSNPNFLKQFKACTTPSHTQSYIGLTKILDFNLSPAWNIIPPCLPDIDLKSKEKVISYGEKFYTYMVMKALELGYKNLTYKDQLRDADVILKIYPNWRGWLLKVLVKLSRSEADIFQYSHNKLLNEHLTEKDGAAKIKKDNKNTTEQDCHGNSSPPTKRAWIIVENDGEIYDKIVDLVDCYPETVDLYNNDNNDEGTCSRVTVTRNEDEVDSKREQTGIYL